MFPEIKTQLEMINEKEMPELSSSLKKLNTLFENDPNKEKEFCSSMKIL